MARYSRIPAVVQVADLRQAPDADVTVEPASETTTDQPELTASDIAPEASPAETKKSAPKRSTKKKSDG